MRLRTRLILAFLLLSVVPLSGATLYSYNASLRALQEAVQNESGQRAREMEKRVEAVTMDLARRIDRLSGLPHWAVGDAASSDRNRLQSLLLAEMGEAARFLERIEFRAEPQAEPVSPSVEEVIILALPDATGTGKDGNVQVELSINLGDDVAAVEGDGEVPFHFKTDAKGGLILQRGPAPDSGAPELPRVEPTDPGQEFLRGLETLSRELEGRHRMRQAGIPVPAAGEEEMRGHLARELGLQEAGEETARFATVRAQISSREVLRQVMSRTQRDHGEIPFAVDRLGNLYTPDPADRPKIEELGLEEAIREDRVPSEGTMIGNWVTVLREDPNTGLYFGIARPVTRSLQQLQATAARNLGLGLSLVGIALLGILPLSRHMTRNLARLTEGVETLAKGDLSARVPVRSRDEFGMLSQAFNRMAKELSEGQRRLLEQERIRRELEIGRQIQQELLPTGILKLPQVEVQGISIPAREVSGDFYNYFPLSDGTVAVLVGDVSGKGVPAALLMANVQASLKAMLRSEECLGSLVDRLDREVESNTPAEVYTTLFLGVLDVDRQKLRYVNAGHNPPFAFLPRGRVKRLVPGGRPVGLLSGKPYHEDSLNLEESCLLFLYTDGLVESENADDEPFGMDRVEAILRRESGAPLDRLLSLLEGALREHRGGGEPTDDATLLALRFGA